MVLRVYSGRRKSTSRDLTYETDRINEFGAVLNTLRDAARVSFVQGLPEDMLLEALLWQPLKKLRRVTERDEPKNDTATHGEAGNEGDENIGGDVEKEQHTYMQLFPRWSWAG